MAGPPGQAVVAAQAEVDGAKPRETITARDLLGRMDLTATVVTADALHTVKATAELIHTRGGHFVLPVKENRPALFDALDTLPWQTVPITHTSTDKGHGRITTRTVQVLPAPDDLPFPHVAQVWLIERYVTATDATPISAVAQLGVTSLPTELATPADLARYNQHHWGIEVLHWIRDTLFREDRSRIRTRNGPRVMASLRNLAISALRLTGRADTTEATRWACRNMNRPFTILNLNQ
jgi:predicted transposase YbfD/YdcC